jgi:hypothetical protein
MAFPLAFQGESWPGAAWTVPGCRRSIGESTNGFALRPAEPESRPPEKIQKQKKNVLASGLSKKSMDK